MIFYAKKENGEIKFQLEKTYQSFVDGLKEGEKLEIEIKKFVVRRTEQQNKALHLYFQHLATSLNEGGHDMRKVISPVVDIMWSPYTVKEHLWRPVQRAYLGEKSTTRLRKMKDIDAIYDMINKTIGERTGIYVEFPNMDSYLEKNNL